MSTQKNWDLSRQAEEAYLTQTLNVVKDNLAHYGSEVSRMQEDIDEMLAHYHDDNVEMLTILNNTVTLHEHMKRALVRNEKALHKPYFGRIIFHDEALDRDESIYIGRGGISKDTTHWMVVDWRAPAANAYYENGLGKCSYEAPDGIQMHIELKHKRTYEIDNGRLLDYFDSEVIANDDLLTKYLSQNKQAVLKEIVATIQKEQNDIIRKTPYHNLIVQGVAGSGKTTVAMHRISYILYNYEERFKPDDFYIVGSNRILLNYITGVLPDLDVYGIRQMTMEQLFVRLLYEDWDDKKYTIKNMDKSNPAESVKGSALWFQHLEEYCRNLEFETISCQSVYLNPKQFVEGIQNGKTGVFDHTDKKPGNPEELICLMEHDAIERYLMQNPSISIQSKINMLNARLQNKIKEEFLGKGIKYTEAERKAILKAYRGYYGGKNWKTSIFDLYRDFLRKQNKNGYQIPLPGTEFDVYDLAALAYLYKRVKETEVISEAHHIVIDEAQDFGMMAYLVLRFCIYQCTYTIMGDVSQNIHFGFGLNDWEALKELFLQNPMSSFGILKKSYRNTVEISEFASNILRHGQFSVYPSEPIIRHGNPVQIRQTKNYHEMIRSAADICKNWQAGNGTANGKMDTIAVICRDHKSAAAISRDLSKYVDIIMEDNPEKAVFGSGIMVLPVEYTKGLEFDAVLILDPSKEAYPLDDGHAKLLYVAATRALHELCVLHTGNLTELMTVPVNPAQLHNIENETTHTPSGNDNTLNKNTRILVKKIPVIPKSPKTEPAVPSNTPIEEEKKNPPKENIIQFGDMPSTGQLRPAGHGKIDLTIRWVTRQADGLYLHSRYGVLRLSPIGSAIVRITFAKGVQLSRQIHKKIAVTRTEQRWMYKDSGKTIDLMTDELWLQTDKASGAIRYMTRDQKLLVTERSRECRQLEAGTSDRYRTWLYFDRQKNESIYAVSADGKTELNLNKTARYISHGINSRELPFLLSDRGYGIVLAAESPVFSCDIPAYGSYLHAENETQIDFYLITGKSPDTIKDAYKYLSGKL